MATDIAFAYRQRISELEKALADITAESAQRLIAYSMACQERDEALRRLETVLNARPS